MWWTMVVPWVLGRDSLRRWRKEVVLNKDQQEISRKASTRITIKFKSRQEYLHLVSTNALLGFARGYIELHISIYYTTITTATAI